MIVEHESRPRTVTLKQIDPTKAPGTSSCYQGSYIAPYTWFYFSFFFQKRSIKIPFFFSQSDLVHQHQLVYDKHVPCVRAFLLYYSMGCDRHMETMVFVVESGLECFFVMLSELKWRPAAR